MVADLRYFNSLEHEVDTLKSQLETQKTQFLNEIDRLSREYYYADHMNAILGVYTDLDEVTNLQCDYLETWEKCKHLEKELSKSRTMSKSFEALQKHAINLELDLQQCKPAIFSDSLAKKDFSKSKPVVYHTKLLNMIFSKPSTLHRFCPQIMCQLSKKHNVIALGMYKVHTKPTQTKTPLLHYDIRKNLTNACIFSKGGPQNVTLYVLLGESCVLNDNLGFLCSTFISMAWNLGLGQPMVEPLVEIILFIVDSGCSKHMTGNLKLLTNFMEKFLGTVKFGNDQIAPILGYGDLVQGTITIKRVYYVEGLIYNCVLPVGQFYDADLELLSDSPTLPLP
ncbi:hypothetical protein Tco_0013688 [Tanacetum coccineum]